MLISLLLPISFVVISLIYPHFALLATPSSGDLAAEAQLAKPARGSHSLL
jgi:hypothetical protein